MKSPRPSSQRQRNYSKAQNKGESKSDGKHEEPVFCVCRGPDDGTIMIQCNYCDDWFHIRCVGLKIEQVDSLQNYCCPSCEDKDSQRRQRIQPRHQSQIKKAETDKDNDNEDEEEVKSRQTKKNKKTKAIGEKPKALEESTTKKPITTATPTKIRQASKREDSSRGYASEHDPVRKTVVEGLTSVLEPFWSEMTATTDKDKRLPFSSPRKMANTIEEEMFKQLAESTPALHGGNELSRCGNAYRAKYRTLQFNLKDPKNGTLRLALSQGHVEIPRLVRMTSAEMANEEIAEEMRRVRQQSITRVILEEEDNPRVASAIPPLKKTHKGEEYIVAPEDGPLANENILSRIPSVTSPSSSLPSPSNMEDAQKLIQEELLTPTNLPPPPSPTTAALQHEEQALQQWYGKVYLPDFEIKRLGCFARALGGSGSRARGLTDSALSTLLPYNLHCSGRIAQSTARSYVSQVWQGSSSSRDVILFQLVPPPVTTDNTSSLLEEKSPMVLSEMATESQAQLDLLISHLTEQQRWAVVAHDPRSIIRDFYLAPWIPTLSGRFNKVEEHDRSSDKRFDVKETTKTTTTATATTTTNNNGDNNIKKDDNDNFPTANSSPSTTSFLEVSVEVLDMITEPALIGVLVVSKDGYHQSHPTTMGVISGNDFYQPMTTTGSSNNNNSNTNSMMNAVKMSPTM